MDLVAYDDTVLHNGFTRLGDPVDEENNPPVPQRSFRDNKFIFEEQEGIEDGLGPTYNAQSCAECHQNPTTGGISQITELRAGHLSRAGTFEDAPGGSLIHSRATAASIQEYPPDEENVRSFRTSLNTMGDGFVECISNSTFLAIRDAQPAEQRGIAIAVPVVEAGGAMRVGRFGWKDQQASLVSFSGDAYLNEMGITNPFQSVEGFLNPRKIKENTSMGNSVDEFDLVPDSPEPEDDGMDARAFADFMRATRVPGRGPIKRAEEKGEQLFTEIGCAVCHVPRIVTAPPGTLINGGEFRVPPELGNKVIHPFSDYLLHDIETGDGIVQNGGEETRTMVRTPPLWGVRTRNRMMHDGEALTFLDAIERHGGQADASRSAFKDLKKNEQGDLFEFLHSL